MSSSTSLVDSPPLDSPSARELASQSHGRTGSSHSHSPQSSFSPPTASRIQSTRAHENLSFVLPEPVPCNQPTTFEVVDAALCGFEDYPCLSLVKDNSQCQGFAASVADKTLPSTPLGTSLWDTLTDQIDNSSCGQTTFLSGCTDKVLAKANFGFDPFSADNSSSLSQLDELFFWDLFTDTPSPTVDLAADSERLKQVVQLEALKKQQILLQAQIQTLFVVQPLVGEFYSYYYQRETSWFFVHE